MSESTPEPASDSSAAEPAAPAASADPEPAELTMVHIRASRYPDEGNIVRFERIVPPEERWETTARSESDG